MPLRYSELALGAQTAYAELLEQAQAAGLQRSIVNLPGGFAAKQVKGHRYWYYQFRDLEGRLRQLYVGPDNASVRSLMKNAQTEAPMQLGPQARAAVALGCEKALAQHSRVIRRLAEHGFFHAGGVLVGTHAFLVLGSLLGVRWREGARTQDLDFAHAGSNVSIALPATVTIDVPRALDSLEMGFLPLTAIGGDSAATYVTPKNRELRLDFLTTRVRRSSPSVKLANLNLEMQPLKYMEFLLEHPIQGALLADDGAVIVNIPSAPRYALHKLLVYCERSSRYRTKAAKDLLQSAALLQRLSSQPEEVRELWADMLRRGPTWKRLATRGRRALSEVEPDLDVQGLLPI